MNHRRKQRPPSLVRGALPHIRSRSGSKLVPGVGVEPTRAFARGILSPLRLPISPSRQKDLTPQKGTSRMPFGQKAMGSTSRDGLDDPDLVAIFQLRCKPTVRAGIFFTHKDVQVAPDPAIGLANPQKDARNFIIQPLKELPEGRDEGKGLDALLCPHPLGQVFGQMDGDQAQMTATSTESARGRWRPTSCQLSPSSGEAKTLPDVVAK